MVFTVFATLLLVSNAICQPENLLINTYISRLNKQAEREVVIAIIDSEFGDLDGIVKKNLWNNIDEKLNNIDDDKNGFVDDKYGWNFVDGNNIFHAAKRSHGESILNFLVGKSRGYSGN